MSKARCFHLTADMTSLLTAANNIDATLLITGNTGTGKSQLAYMVHESSPRFVRGKWFQINLATLSENLIESELFGHEKGAFTGALNRRVGRLEACNNGTVFLDEIGELSPRMQAKLLDFIQYRKITPVGSNREITLNVRIIAATNKNLEQSVRAGEFRADLFHRLNVFHVQLPDIATMPSIIMKFTDHFIEEKCRQTKRNITGVSRDVEKIFKYYSWPGNIRELENVIEYAAAMEYNYKINVYALPKYLQDFALDKLGVSSSNSEPSDDQKDGSSADNEVGLKPLPSGTKLLPMTSIQALKLMELPINMDFRETKETFEKAYLEEALRWCGGQINLTSRKIGLSKVSLADKIKRYGIDWRKIRYESLVRSPYCHFESLHPGEHVEDSTYFENASTADQNETDKNEKEITKEEVLNGVVASAVKNSENNLLEHRKISSNF